MGEYTIEEHTPRSLGYEFDNYWGWYKATPAGYTLWIDQDHTGWRISLATRSDKNVVIKTDVTNLVDYLKSLEIVFFQGQ